MGYISSWVTVAVISSLALVSAAAPSPLDLKSDLTILVENDLEGPGSKSPASGIILLSGQNHTLTEADSACKALGEQLWSPALNRSTVEVVQRQIDYLVLRQSFTNATRFWIAPQKGDNGTVDGPHTINAEGHLQPLENPNEQLPAVCTQSAPFSSMSSGDTSETWRVAVKANDDTLTGYRDRVSFRFLGIRYASQPGRFRYSTPYQGSGGNYSVLKIAPACIQLDGSGSEDCLFLNIWTPYLPQDGASTAKNNLRPVMFWIHGGAFTSASGGDSFSDGGNFASRNDAVVVAINYRLGTLGFMAIDDGETNGNYGLADQVNALDWVISNIRSFGGDPSRITIYGQSAGAASVRALLASPKAAGKFAAAIPMSGLGGLNYGTTYAKYFTIEEEMKTVGNEILTLTGCSTAVSRVDCLRQVPLSELLTITPARYLVVDGTYLTTDELELKSGPPLSVHLMMGSVREDGAPFIAYPTTTNETEYLAQIGFNPPSPSLFPIPTTTTNSTLNLYNMASRLATDAMFRCIDQATVHAALRSGRLGTGRAFYYEFDRTYQTAGWPRLDVCEPPRTAAKPNGDPSLPYLRCHSGELNYVFGNVVREDRPARDDADFPFQRLVVDMFGAFARDYDPNPDECFLETRGYAETLSEVRRSGQWLPATKDGVTLRELDWPSRQGPFRELPQCESLGLGLGYYE
ncbi:hypothetical protein MCOR25_006903 [Pyricularia grisea]|nr:hypothetical protein MCOR25_006903 [Pyricularia grisea]